MHGHVRKRHTKTCATRLDKARRCNCDGSWQARYPDPNGRNNTSKVERTFRHKRDAEAFLVSQASSKLDGTHIDPRKAERPASEIFEAWKESWGGRLSPTTERRYQSILDKYLMPEFASRKIGTVSHEVIQRYVNALNANPKIAPGTVRNVYAVLRSAFNKGVRMGLVPVNPCAQIDLPRPNRQEMKFLSHGEVKKLAETIDPQFRVLIYFAAYTGLRAEEIGGLQRKDVDLLRGTVRVERALKDVNGRQVFGPTKTHERRSISLPRFLRDMLSDHLAQVSPGGNGPEDLVRPVARSATATCTSATSRRRRRFFQPKSAASAFTISGTRAPLSLSRSRHPKLIQARLGHSSITVTLDRYGHLFPSMEEALAGKLDAAREAALNAEASATNVVELRAEEG